MSKKKRNIIIICVVFLIFIVLGIGFYFHFKNKSTNIPEVKQIEVVDKIEGYGYTLEDRDTDIFKSNFLELKKNLESDNIDYDAYASNLSKLFLIDLYTIDNKTTKYDVGGLDFIYESEKEKFSKKALDSMYKLVEDNNDNKRKQELPEVSDVKILKEENTIYEKDGVNLNAYKYNIQIGYVKDLGYDENVSLTLVLDNNHIYVVKLESES